MELQTETNYVDHSDHLYPRGDQTPYDELVELLEDSLEIGDAPLPSVFLALRTAETAILVNRLRLSDAAEVIRRLPLDTAIALCDFPDLNRRALICEQLAPELAASILEGLSSDELTYILRGMSAHERHRLLPLVSPEVRKEVDLLLRYRDNTAGGIMTTEFVSLRSEMSVREALDYIKRNADHR